MLGKTPPPPPADNPARRFTDSVDAHVTVIGPGTRIKGELIADGPVELAGTLEGDIRVTAHCRVRQSLQPRHTELSSQDRRLRTPTMAEGIFIAGLRPTAATPSGACHLFAILCHGSRVYLGKEQFYLPP